MLWVRIKGAEVCRMTLTEGSATLGSAETCDLVIPHGTVSRTHARLTLTRGGVRVTDLGSTNGVRFHGAKVTDAFVPFGSVLMLGRAELRLELAAREPLARMGALSSRAPPMVRAIELLTRVADGDTTVLLHGETGTGKELAARALHAASEFRDGPFEVVDCGSLPRDLAGAELFGHERGAFTGAERARPGAFERAEGGTLFLDEIGELPLDQQPLLLRALERREVRRLGSEAYRPVRVRVVAATHRNLKAEVDAGRFREDLLHRLAVVPVHLPPLRERVEDIPLLARDILDRLGPRAIGVSFSPRSLQAMQAYPWPGNVRELRNVVERAVALSEEPELSLPNAGPGPTARELPIVYAEARRDALEAFERDFVIHLLRTFDRNVSKAAREAGIDRAYLHKLIRKHNLDVRQL